MSGDSAERACPEYLRFLGVSVATGTFLARIMTHKNMSCLLNGRPCKEEWREREKESNEINVKRYTDLQYLVHQKVVFVLALIRC